MVHLQDAQSRQTSAHVSMGHRPGMQYGPKPPRQQPSLQAFPQRGMPVMQRRQSYNESDSSSSQRPEYVNRYINSAQIPSLVQHPRATGSVPGTQAQGPVQRTHSADMQQQDILRQHLLRQILQRLSPEQHAILASLQPHQQQQAMVTILQNYQAEQQKVLRQLQAKEQQQRAFPSSPWATNPASSNPNYSQGMYQPHPAMGNVQEMRFSASKPQASMSGASLLGPGTTSLGSQVPANMEARGAGINGLVKIARPLASADLGTGRRDPRFPQPPTGNSEMKVGLPTRPSPSFHESASRNGSHLMARDQTALTNRLESARLPGDVDEAASKHASANAVVQRWFPDDLPKRSDDFSAQKQAHQAAVAAAMAASTAPESPSNGIVQSLLQRQQDREQDVPSVNRA